ncbi:MULTISPECIES: YgiW/YdeI family stress tolerance OB fold protein [Vibrio]|uniref:NirD/YgiW/YdeI family stress tolerance protein n=1 Tax=Vibrio mediterranei TaxID=689 RepID=A0A3G4VJP0_9VIBR|nr:MULTISPECIES: NirD/YgiW/YdeI family stress tolerance protein [Vibrio]AYV24605.1 NirD/YgiW/YdeI family stress tolerance protein [Vibrio mediterranei]MCF4174499.1 NirD/YgiW/YdeI family stress tolerance protein [Vibrio sp. McD22-P3]MCY9853805.1 NirD/YgiW/YdeI family stress tolerance protein [Vibrio mediterranei]USE03487.1 NirD/YgiW/YdeI family stress tolerance protein [Vibrio sp. SCSIO 43133]
MKKTVLTLAAALILTPTLVLAKDGGHHDSKSPSVVYTGPVETISVTELLTDTSMFTEKNVIVDGYLVRQVRDDKFIFSDGDAEIQVDMDDARLTTPINNETKVRIFGEYEGGNTPEIEVDHIQIM